MPNFHTPPPKPPSFSQRLAAATGNAIEGTQGLLGQRQEAKALQSLGIPVGLPPELAKTYLAERLRGENKANLNPLQQTQQSLAEERLKALKGEQSLFDQLRSGGRSATSPQEGDGGAPAEGQQSFSTDQLRQLAAFKGQPGQKGIIGNMAQAELDAMEKKEKFAREESSQRGKAERSEAFEIVKPLMLELQQSRKNIPLQEQAIQDIKNASGSTGIRDYLADIFKIEPLRSAEGAKLKTAIKDFFLSDLTRVGARPNQWIEQQLADALPKIGRSKEANLITAAGMEFKVNLAKKRLEILDQLSEQDKSKHGYIKGDIDSRASQLMKPYAEQAKKELIDSIDSIKKGAKPSKGFTRMVDPKTGEAWDILENNVKSAEKEGWRRQ